MQTEPAALLLDVFGTCVDWRASITRQGEALGRRLGLQGIDWAVVADAWRARYQPQMELVRSGRRPWTNLVVPHREALDRVLTEFELDGMPETERAEFTRGCIAAGGWLYGPRGRRSLGARL